MRHWIRKVYNFMSPFLWKIICIIVHDVVGFVNASEKKVENYLLFRLERSECYLKAKFNYDFLLIFAVKISVNIIQRGGKTYAKKRRKYLQTKGWSMGR